MKVIFLDVDGVLNSEKDLLEAKGKFRQIMADGARALLLPPKFVHLPPPPK